MVPGCVVKEHQRYGWDGAAAAPAAVLAEEIEEFLDDISVITGELHCPILNVLALTLLITVHINPTLDIVRHFVRM